MRKLHSDFYKKLSDLRSLYGESEYSRNDILPAVMALISEFLKDGKELLRDAAIAILDSAEKTEDQSKEGLFPYDGQVALGGTRRIKRGAMNKEQHRRRKLVIDSNLSAVHHAWSSETQWLNIGQEALKDLPDDTRRSDVLDEAGLHAA